MLGKEGDGYLLLYKRLAPGYRFHWPRNEQEARELTHERTGGQGTDT